MQKPTSFIVLRFSSLGDIAMIVPCLLALNRTYPTIKIYLVSASPYKFLFDSIPNLIFIPIDFKGKHKGIVGIGKLINELRKIPSKTIIDLHDVIRSKVITFFFNLIGYHISVFEKGREEKKQYIQKKIKTPLKHMSQRYAEVFQKINFPIEITSFDILNKSKETHSVQRIGIAPFSKHKGKEYSLDHIKQIVEILTNQKNYTFYIFGFGNNEKQIIDAIFSSFPNVVNTIGTSNFKHELDLISNLDIMISMDSGNGHLAAIFGVPVLTIWGVTHFDLGYSPYNMPYEYSIEPSSKEFPELPVSIYGKCHDQRLNNAINSITPESVVQKINTILNAATK